jgi:hypothetical protein
LLCNDSEMGGYTRAVSGQRLGEHIPVPRHQIHINVTVGLQQWKRCVSTWSVPRNYKRDEVWSLVSKAHTGSRSAYGVQNSVRI